ncbi:MAG: polyphosphate kinase 1 [Bacteroidia bacterium]|nr:polyphosphate kinase 1 [Bacteroidia bacterium]
MKTAEIQDTEQYFPRELSWLSFNLRVLMEAKDTSLPLYERIKFLAIYSSNLNEFFRVRVASIQSLLDMKESNLKTLRFNPEALLNQIYTEVNRQQEEFGRIFRDQILHELRRNHIHLIRGTPIEPAHKKFVGQFFEEEVRAFLHPELLRKNKIVHFLRDGAMYHSVKLRNRPRSRKELLPAELKASSKKRTRYALIQIPTHYFPRFIELPRIGNEYYIMFLDDIIRCNLERIFPGYEVVCCHSIKVNRNADLMIEDEFSGDLVEKIKESLKKRKIGETARFLYDQNMPRSMLTYLRETFGIEERELMMGGTYHNFMDFFNFPNPLSPQLERSPTPPLPRPEMDAHPFMVSAIREQNRILHFPYQSYDYVIRFLNQAAIDPDVEEIWATQYRVASNSAVVTALIRAAQNGKKVTVFVELKARFDEALNLQSARDMEQAGATVIYSIPGLKVHAKVALVLRREDGAHKGYAFLSTGNFNEKTARIYADHGFFTADQVIVQELQELFRYLQNQEYIPRPFERLMVAPFNMRSRFESLISREIAHAKAGGSGKILIKLNNLDDERMIDRLYEASRAGVRITLIIRGMCSLRPGIPGLSEHIRVIRIVDQFLEHARVYYFGNQGNPELYLGSADWMHRNLSRRIEVVFPILDPELAREVMALVDLQLQDNVKATELDRNLRDTPVKLDPVPRIRMQAEAYHRIKAGRLLDAPK